MFRRALSYVLIGSFFGACSPPPSNQTATENREASVWLKKSVAENLHSHKQECGSLISQTPTAFSVDATGSMQLIVRNAPSLEIGQIGSAGTSSGAFAKIQSKQNSLFLQSWGAVEPVEYVRSSFTEANDSIRMLDDCIAGLDPRSPEDLENRAILAKNKIQLSLAESQDVTAGQIALAVLFAGSIVNSVHAGMVLHDRATTLTEARDYNYSLNTVETIAEQDVIKEFEQFKKNLGNRLPKEAPLSKTKPAKYRRVINELLDFEKVYQASSQKGPLILSPHELNQLHSLQNRFKEIRAEILTEFKSPERLAKMEVLVAQARKYLTASVIATSAISGYYAYTGLKSYFSTKKQLARNSKLLALLEQDDDSLRKLIRKDPSLATVLIEAEEQLKLQTSSGEEGAKSPARATIF